MAKQRCVDAENTYYHVYNRGVNKQNIFLEDFDRYFFIKLCRKAIEKFDISIHAFCLMNNHYHLIIYTQKDNLSKTMKFIGESYSKYFLQKYRNSKKSGHTFTGRYGRKVIADEQYMKTVLNYIHLNPVKDSFCKHPSLYKWSSYKTYADQFDHYNFIEHSTLKKYYQNHSTLDQVAITNNLLEIKSIDIEPKKLINSAVMKEHLKEYSLDSETYKKLYTYCLLEWTELNANDLVQDLKISPNSIRKLKSRIQFDLEDNNHLLFNIIYSVRKNLELF